MNITLGLIKLDQNQKIFLRKWVALSLIIHLVAATFSTGYYHADEHFQVLEFANAFLGVSSFKSLSWEYHDQMRAWVQPLIYSGIIQIVKWIGLNNPMDFAWVLRVFSSLIGWIASGLLMILSFLWVSEARVRATIRGLALFWVVPYIHARTSGENLGGSLFWIGFALFFLLQAQGRIRVWNLFVIGCLFGLSFWTRFQMGVIICSFLIFVSWKNQFNKKILFALSFGIGVSSFMCFIFDFIGYGVWTFSPWNYFFINLVERKSEMFGVWPWWQYIRWSVEFIPPLSGVILFASLIACFVNLKHPLVWSILPYFLVLCLIKNKDLRYLFVILPALPLLIGMGFPYLNKKLKGILLFLQIENALLLLVISVKPNNSSVLLYSYLARHFPNEVELVSTDSDPFHVFELQNTFYRPQKYQFKRYSNYQQIEQEFHRPFLLFSEKLELPEEAGRLRQSCKVIHQTFPAGFRKFDLLGRIPKLQNRVIYRCYPEGMVDPITRRSHEGYSVY